MTSPSLSRRTHFARAIPLEERLAGINAIVDGLPSLADRLQTPDELAS